MLPPPADLPARPARSFTLIELLVTIVIFVMLIIGVALIFRTTARAVGVSEANLELLSNVRAAQDQIARDFAGYDRTTFMVIRHRVVPLPDGAARNAPWYHVDQVAFIAHGNFPYRVTGPDNTPLGEQTAHAALIWYGHLVVEGTDVPLGNTYPIADQSHAPVGLDPDHPYNIVPSGRTPDDFILGRHVTLLIAQNQSLPNHVIIGSQNYPAYPMPWLYAPPIDVGEEKPAHITSSRVSLACTTPGQIMQRIRLTLFQDPGARSAQPLLGRPPPITEAQFCFRFKTLLDPFTTEVRAAGLPSLANGVSRMSSIFLPGVSSFSVDGIRGSMVGQPEGGVLGGDNKDPTGDSVSVIDSAADNSAAEPDGRPSALRITMRVADPSHRLTGGRVFQQIVQIP
jgi:type II secretory pathway pseudopilin PulG